MQRIANP